MMQHGAGQGTPSTLLSPAAAPAHSWVHAAWPPAVAAAATSIVAEPQPDWVPDCRYLSGLAAANDQLQQRPLAGVWWWSARGAAYRLLLLRRAACGWGGS